MTELQRAVAMAEQRAIESVASERLKMERLLLETTAAAAARKSRADEESRERERDKARRAAARPPAEAQASSATRLAPEQQVSWLDMLPVGLNRSRPSRPLLVL